MTEEALKLRKFSQGVTRAKFGVFGIGSWNSVRIYLWASSARICLPNFCVSPKNF
jgi:hypothetical protein